MKAWNLKVSRRALRTFLAVGVVGLLAFLSIQMPARTGLRIVFAPRIPSDFAGSHALATMHPQHGLPFVLKGSALEPFHWKNLIEDSTEDLKPSAPLRDGVAFYFHDHWLSLGGKVIKKARIDIPGVASERPIALWVDINDEGEPTHQGLSLCSKTAGSETSVRPRRSGCDGNPWTLLVFGALGACRGRDQVIVLDTSPLPFLVPDGSWERYRRSVSNTCYSSLRADAEPTDLVDSDHIPLEGADLSYSIEDELDGTAYPRPEALTVSAKVIDRRQVDEISGRCLNWTGKTKKECWRSFQALPKGVCASVWPVALDAKKRVLHVDFVGTFGLDCYILLAVEAPEGDSLHAMALALSAPMPSR